MSKNLFDVYKYFKSIGRMLFEVSKRDTQVLLYDKRKSKTC